MPQRPGVHKVGLTAAALGIAALFALPFATYRSSRIQTGEPVLALGALGPGWFALCLAVWLALAAFSLRDDRRPVPAALRGCAASAALLVTVALSAVAVERLLVGAPGFARVSMGSGAWVAITAAYMAVLGARREVGPAKPAGVALLALAPVGVTLMLLSGKLSGLGMLREYANQRERFWAEVVAHLTYSAAAMGIAVVLGVALGMLAFVRPRLRGPVFATVSVFQTIPGLALVGLLFGPLSWLGANVPALKALGVGGLGWAPVVTALTLYALLAVVRNAYAGLASVPPETIDAGVGMGMTESQVMRRLRLPLAMPVLFGGVRTGMVQTIGNATLGAFVAAGTLGLFVFGGLSQQAMDLIMLGSVSLVFLALIVDGALRVVQRLVSPRHLEAREAEGP